MGKSFDIIAFVYRFGFYIAIGITVLVLVGLQYGDYTSSWHAKQESATTLKDKRKQLRYERTGKLEP